MPLPVIHTTRLLLRPWALEDVDALHALWTAPEVRRYLWDDTIITREVAAQLVANHLETSDRHGIGFWALHATGSGATSEALMAGFCGFRFFEDGSEIELLYGLRAAYWRRGLAAEASRAAIEYVWRSTAFQRVYARTDSPNERSVRVIERLGMTPDSSSDALITFVLRRP